MLALLGTCLTLPAAAAQWGTLTGRLVFAGTPPTPQPVQVHQDTPYCGQQQLVDETLVVGQEGSLANVFVYLYVQRGQSVEVHPDLAPPPTEPVVLENKGCRFQPHACLVRTGQTLEIRNADVGIGHNTNAQALLTNPKFNEQVSHATPILKTFKKSEPYPIELACNVHPWMKGYVLIRDNPYMAVSDATGHFKISKLPAGQHPFIFWHEASGNLRALPVGNTHTSRRGRARLTIPAGQTLDVGAIRVPASMVGGTP